MHSKANVPLWGGKVMSPVFRCLASNYLNAETSKLHKCFLDIEVDFDKDKGFADPKSFPIKVTSIALYLDWLDELICLCLKFKRHVQEKAQEIVRFDNTILCDSEAQLLETFIPTYTGRRYINWLEPRRL